MGGSSKGGGSSSASYNYYASILIGIGEGPLDALVSILEDAKEIWHGPLSFAGASNPALITIPDRGRLWLRWGTADQVVSPRLALFDDHPPYADQAGIEADDFLLGLERATSPNWEFVCSRKAKQTLVTGSAAALDGNGQCNLVAFIAELATSATGLALPPEKFYGPSWQAVADALNTDDMRSLFAISPLLTQQTAFRDLLTSLGQAAQIWARRRDDGTIELGWWTPPTDVSGLPLFTADDLTEDLEYDTSDMEGLPVAYTIGFTDSTQLYKADSERVPDLAAIRVTPVPPADENIDHPEIMLRAQARRYVTEYMRQRRGGALTGTAKLRRSKAISVRPGDYFRLDIDTIPGGAGLAQLMRCIGRTFGPTGPVSLEFQSEPGSAPVPFSPAWGDNTPVAPPAVPPIYAVREISLPPDAGEEPTITPLAVRPADDAIGAQMLYDDDLEAGTFAALGSFSGFALPVRLAQALAADGATARVSTFAAFGDGSRADRERWLLETGAGAGEAEARDDTLLLVLVKKNPATGAIVTAGNLHYVEVCSVRSISLVSADTWDLGILRGRLNTVALGFSAGSFPDDWSNYEGWIIQRASMARFNHGDFVGLTIAGAAGYFRYRPYTRFGSYDPAIAHEAGLQATDDWTTWPFIWPSGFLVAVSDYVEYVFCRSATQPTTPTGDGIPAEWYDLPPAGTDQCWMSSAPKRAGISLAAWATPQAWGDDVQYSADGAMSWHPVYVDGDKYYETRSAGGAWSTPIRFAGEDATRYWMVALGGVKKNSSGAFVPASITPSALQQTGTDAVLAYSGRFIIEDSPDGSTWTTRYTSSADESSHTFAPTAGSVAVRVSLYLAGGTTAMVDRQIVPITADGSNGSNGTNGSNGVAVLGTTTGSGSGTGGGSPVATGISVTVTTSDIVNILVAGTLTNNSGYAATCSAIVCVDGSQVGVSFSAYLANGASTSMTIVATPSVSAGSHVIAIYVAGPPGTISASATLTAQ
jgi:Putative phage tail protein